jgi:hypothetical protein
LTSCCSPEIAPRATDVEHAVDAGDLLLGAVLVVVVATAALAFALAAVLHREEW